VPTGREAAASSGRVSSSRSSASGGRFVRTSLQRAVSRLVSRAVEEAELGLVMERLVKAEKFNVKMEAKEEEEKFKFSKSGCKKQFKFNMKMKDRFVVDLKTELENCFDKELPEGVESLVKEVKKEIDDQNVKLKIADEFGFEAIEEFSNEDLARNQEEERKIKVFRKEKKDRERKTVKKGKASGRGWKNLPPGVSRRCYSCLGVGHVATDCGKQGFKRGFKESRR
jgi:hypothetical protein